MNKTYIYIVIAILGTLSISCKSQVKEETQIEEEVIKPNILIVFPDQLRRYSAGFWSEEPYKNLVIGNPDLVVTPNIDKLAKNGVVFTQAVSNYPLCSPYRGMMLSGMYPEQNGIWNNCKVGRNHSLKSNIPTIPSLFLESGYNTAYFGKCHWLKPEPVFDENGNYLGKTTEPGGHYVNQYDTYVPPGKDRHGIEYFYESIKDSHYNPHVYSNDPLTIEGKSDGELHLPKIFSPKNESKKIIDYLRNTHGQRDVNKPFCMIWAMNPPHNPWGDDNTDMETLKKHYGADKFPHIDTLLVRKNADKEVGDYVRHYYANVTSSDYYIGLVLEELEKMEALDNTIVVFSSDHGEMLGSHGRSGKNAVELESSAIPFIVHWPKKLEKGTSNVLFSVPDVLPTIMGLAGIGNKIPEKIEGIDFSPLLLKNEKSSNVQKPEAILFMLGNSRGVFTERYSLCLRENKKQWDNQQATEIAEAFIYDNLEDPYQLNKIDIKEKPKLAKKLLQHLGGLLEKTNDPWFKEKRYSNIIPYASN